MNRHATVAQLREVLATLRDDDCVHSNLVGNLTVLRKVESPVEPFESIGYIELSSGETQPDDPAAVWRWFSWADPEGEA
jgi:hypothetical protein